MFRLDNSYAIEHRDSFRSTRHQFSSMYIHWNIDIFI